jgi:hypothetical protein
MTRPMTIAVDDDLFVLTIRLTEEYPEIPAGSVMRCVARVLRQARLAGVPPEMLSAETARTSRLVLTRRSATAASGRRPDPVATGRRRAIPSPLSVRRAG